MTAYEPEGATGGPGGRDSRGTAGAGAGHTDSGYDAVVLAGGAARRLGGEDKPGVRVGGRTLLDRVLAACADAGRTVVVAEPRATARPVEWAREDPPGGGPVAALDAGLRRTAAPYVLVLSADLPFLEEKTVQRLLDTLRTGPHTTPPAPDAPERGSEVRAPHDEHHTGSQAQDTVPGGHRTGPEGQRATAPGGHHTAPDEPAARPGGQDAASGGRDLRAEGGGTHPGRQNAGPADGQDAASGGRDLRAEGGGARPGGQDAGLVGEDPRAEGRSTRPARHDARPEAGGAHPGPATARPDGVLLTDPGGRDQPLVAVYRADALRRELDGLSAAHGGLSGLPLRRVVAALDLTRITDPVASFDCDTWDDIAAARARIREHGHVLDEWISAVKDELGIDLDVDTGVLLDLARDAAHGVARPAAPLTTFLVGYAAARAGGGPEAVAEAARKAAALALRWADEDTPEARPDAPASATPAPPAAEPDAG